MGSSDGMGSSACTEGMTRPAAANPMKPALCRKNLRRFIFFRPSFIKASFRTSFLKGARFWDHPVTTVALGLYAFRARIVHRVIYVQRATFMNNRALCKPSYRAYFIALLVSRGPLAAPVVILPDSDVTSFRQRASDCDGNGSIIPRSDTNRQA